MANDSVSDGPAQDRAAALDAAAQRLVDAAATHTPCAPLREILPDGTMDDGYFVQQLVLARDTGQRRQVGRKIGLTSPAVQQQMGVDVPDFGVLFADMEYGDSQPIPMERLMQPRAEAEVAFVLGRDLPDRPVTIADVLRATEFVTAAIEVVDSRIANWDISIFDTVADNASSGLYVLSGSPRSLTDIDDLRDVRMSMTENGVEVSAGTGAACLGHPVNAVVWLANVVAERGAPLRAGEVLLSGSLGKLAPVRPGATYEARIEGLGSVRAVFTG
ncbi:MAG TPA: fumarylacetoacetate hydrolase family protein [Ilumatobacter sp.]|nr:fumarylacetoacetate hydrolase family protein [Ilumatobacter sp.]